MPSQPFVRVHANAYLCERGLDTADSSSSALPAADWLALPELTERERRNGTAVSLHAAPGGEALARVLVLPGEDCGLLERSALPAASRRATAVLSQLQLSPGAAELLPALMYCAGRRARIGGAVTLVGGAAAPDAPALGSIKLSPIPGWQVDGVQLGAQRMDMWMHNAYLGICRGGATVDTQLFADEVAETIHRWIGSGRDWSFFVALREHRLSRQQYVYLLSNLYQFVRHTTRLIGRAIGHSEDPQLRRHWINHLNGEINHEVIIEHDLAHMGEDVDFVKHHMAPNARTHEFMAVQESAIGYYADPVLMMASPLAAEAVTAYLDQQFVDDLITCIESWGIAEPRRAGQFLISHMTTDGGEDGHYRMSLEALPRLLQDEARLALFLTTNSASRRAMEGVWNSCADETAVWNLA